MNHAAREFAHATLKGKFSHDWQLALQSPRCRAAGPRRKPAMHKARRTHTAMLHIADSSPANVLRPRAIASSPSNGLGAASTRNRMSTCADHLTSQPPPMLQPPAGLAPCRPRERTP
eukprot:3606741-Alexandrium_andersonii.AAC.1